MDLDDYERHLVGLLCWSCHAATGPCNARQRQCHCCRKKWSYDRRRTQWELWTSPRMAGAGLRVYAAISYSAGDLYPSDECRRTRLKKTSMYSNRLALACSLVANLSP